MTKGMQEKHTKTFGTCGMAFALPFFCELQCIYQAACEIGSTSLSSMVPKNHNGGAEV